MQLQNESYTLHTSDLLSSVTVLLSPTASAVSLFYKSEYPNKKNLSLLKVRL